MYLIQNEDIQKVNGGLAPAVALGYLIGGAGYIGALQVFADIGAGIGRGFYDATH